MSLTGQIKELLENIAATLPSETADIMGQAMQKLEQSGLTDHSCRNGDKAPAFELPDALGDTISSSTLLQQGPLVINFYRGSW